MSHWRLEFTDVKISQEAMFHKWRDIEIHLLMGRDGLKEPSKI